ISIESRKADLDGVFDEIEPAVDVSRRDRDVAALLDESAGELVAETQPQVIGDRVDPARERIVGCLGVSGENRRRSPRGPLVASEIGKELFQRIGVEWFASESAREERDELPKVEI